MSDSTAGDGRTMHDRAAELLEGYVLEALEPSEAALVDEHLDDGCDDCEEEVGILRQVAQALPLGSRLFEPSDRLRGQILAAAGGGPSGATPALMRRESGSVAFLRRPMRSLSGSFAVAAGVSMIAIGGLLAWAVVLQTQVDDLQGENSSLVSALSDAESRFNSNVASLVWTAADGDSVQFVSESGSSARARLLWDPEERLFMIAAMGLSPTNGEGAYVAWVETESGPVKLATLHVGATGASVVEGYTEIHLAEASSMTITHEDNPETTTPTGGAVLTFLR